MHKSYLLLAIKWIGLIWIGSIGMTDAGESFYGPVKSGEMLWKIAGKVRPNSSITREQVVVSLLKTNPLAFSAPCNFNSLKVGSKLQVPSLSDMQTFDAQEAKKQVDEQSKAWKNRSKKAIECASPEVSPSSTVTLPTSQDTSVTPSPEKQEAIHTDKSKSSSVQAQTDKKPAEETASTVAVPPTTTVPATTAPAATSSVAKGESPKTSATEEHQSASNIPLPPAATTSLSTPPAAVKENTPPHSSSDASEKAVALVADNEETAKEKNASGESSSPPKIEEENPQGGQQSLMLIILAGGGLLAAFIIGWLLRKHIKTCADETVDSKESPDQMPLRTEKKGV